MVVRIKNKYNLELRGADFPLPDESNLVELANSRFHSENKIQIDVSKDTPSIWVQLFTERSNNDKLENRVNTILIDQIPDDAKEAMINGILEIVTNRLTKS